MHREKRRLAPDILDELAGWQLAAPVIVVDAGPAAFTAVTWRAGSKGEMTSASPSLACARPVSRPPPPLSK